MANRIVIALGGNALQENPRIYQRKLSLKLLKKQQHL